MHKNFTKEWFNSKTFLPYKDISDNYADVSSNNITLRKTGLKEATLKPSTFM